MRTYATGLEPRYGKGIEGIRQGTFHVMTDEIKKRRRRILERRRQSTNGRSLGFRTTSRRKATDQDLLRGHSMK